MGVTATANKKNRYIVSWNEEWASMRIDAGPMGQEEAVRKLKEITMRRLLELGIAESAEEAEELYRQAGDPLTSNKCVFGLSVCPENMACIPIDGDSDEWIGIVEYPAGGADGAYAAKDGAADTAADTAEGIPGIPEERKDEIIRSLLGEYMEGITSDGLEILRGILSPEELSAYGYDLSEVEPVC